MASSLGLLFPLQPEQVPYDQFYLLDFVKFHSNGDFSQLEISEYQ